MYWCKGLRESVGACARRRAGKELGQGMRGALRTSLVAWPHGVPGCFRKQVLHLLIAAWGKNIAGGRRFYQRRRARGARAPPLRVEYGVCVGLPSARCVER